MSKPTYFWDIQQYSDSYWELRNGFPTCSAFKNILTQKTMKPSAAQDGYIDELIADLADLRPNFFSDKGRKVGTPAMEAGREAEPESRRWYQMREPDVRECGFVVSACGRWGYSPDGVIGGEDGDGLLELKNPLLATQARYLRSGGADLLDEYRCQCHGGLIVTGRKWIDLVSYAPGLEPIVLRVVPDDFTEKLRKELDAFYVKYEAAVRKLLPRSRWPVAMRAADADAAHAA